MVVVDSYLRIRLHGSSLFDLVSNKNSATTAKILAPAIPLIDDNTGSHTAQPKDGNSEKISRPKNVHRRPMYLQVEVTV